MTAAATPLGDHASAVLQDPNPTNWKCRPLSSLPVFTAISAFAIEASNSSKVVEVREEVKVNIVIAKECTAVLVKGGWVETGCGRWCLWCVLGMWTTGGLRLLPKCVCRNYFDRSTSRWTSECSLSVPTTNFSPKCFWDFRF
jgi:hypothetical protein